MTENQNETIAFLSDADSYGLRANVQVERCATHASVVFLAGDFAYKLKRAVRYPYLDYSTVERRRAMCEAELSINRRLAPSLYLEVRPVARDTNARLHFGSSDESAVDWVLVMRRFAQADLLENVRRVRKLDRQTIRVLGDSVAAFHGRAERKPEFGGAPGIERVLQENAEILKSFAGSVLAIELIEELCSASYEKFASIRSLLEQRRTAGYVRRCHGDLHLNNICLVDGRPTPFDAIEFNDDLACIDVLYDLAFLLMDLDRHGSRDLANALLNQYLEKMGDYGGLAALPLFLSCRAAIRAHVSASTARMSDTASDSQEQAVAYLKRAISYLISVRPRLIAIGGLSGTGKSTLAYALAPLIDGQAGAVVLRSDLVRKKLMGADELVRLSPEAYRQDVTKRVYREIADTTAGLLNSGCSVIADAVHGSEDERAGIEGVAQRAGVSFVGFWLNAPPAMLEARVAARSKDASDADLRVLRQQLSTISAPRDWTKVDVSGSQAQVLDSVRALLAQKSNSGS